MASTRSELTPTLPRDPGPAEPELAAIGELKKIIAEASRCGSKSWEFSRNTDQRGGEESSSMGCRQLSTAYTTETLPARAWKYETRTAAAIAALA